MFSKKVVVLVMTDFEVVVGKCRYIVYHYHHHTFFLLIIFFWFFSFISFLFYLKNATVNPYLMDSLSGYLTASVSAIPFISFRFALSCVFRSSYCLLIAL